MTDSAVKGLLSIFLIFSVWLVSPPGFADQQLSQDAWKKSETYFQKLFRQEQVVGGSFSLLYRGKTLGELYFGDADRELGHSVDSDTLFHWASITKTFTTVAILQLAERGMLSVDDPVTNYLSEFEQIHNPYGAMSEITVWHLLTHSSGMRRFTWPFTDNQSWQPYAPKKWDQLVAMFPYSRIQFPPGTKSSYSNPGISVLGRLIEKVTGEKYEVYLDKNLLKPLGMTRSYFNRTPWHLRQHRANSYRGEQGKLREFGPEFDTGVITANGGLNGPVSDMTKYLNFLLGVGDSKHHETVLPRQAIDSMFEAHFVTDYYPGITEYVGLGFYLFEHDRGQGASTRYVGHTGTQKGFRSFIYFHPQSRAAVVMAVNSRPEQDPRKLLDDSRLWLLQELFPALWKQGER